MPELPLLSKANKKTQQTYNVPLLTSYAGYPVIPAKSMGLEDYYNKDGKQVAGIGKPPCISGDDHQTLHRTVRVA